MVYESDFYTSRRPYSRPTVTSYSVTRREVPWDKVPTVPRPSQVPPCFTVFGSKTIPGQTYHRNIPLIAHKRLVNVGPSAHGVRVKQSVVLAEIDRITHKVRPSSGWDPQEEFLNSRAAVSFDDETRSIRAKTAELLKRIHTPVPRAQRPLPLAGDTLYSHSELPLSGRITSDNYINRLLEPNRQVQRDILTLSQLTEPPRNYSSIGRGHLACVSFAGGRPISKRRNLASPDDRIRDDIQTLSHYGRFRKAANEITPHFDDSEYIPSVERIPPSKSERTGSWKSNAPPKGERTTINPGHLTAAEEFDAAQDRKKKRRENIELSALREAEEEKKELARRAELERQEELAAEAASERQEELEKRAAQALQEEAERQAAAEKLEAEKRAEEEKKATEEAERKAEEARVAEEEKRAQEEAEKKAKKEAVKKAKEEAEKKAKEEEERKAKEELERLAREEEERKAKEEAERLAREEEERKAQEEAERLAEEERLAREEAERQAKEEADRLAKEEADRLAKEEADRIAQEEADRLAQEEENKAADADSEEPIVEEPTSPEVQNEVPAATTAEEVEEEEEEEDEEEE